MERLTPDERQNDPWPWLTPVPEMALQHAQMFTCGLCGALLFDREQHATWHARWAGTSIRDLVRSLGMQANEQFTGRSGSATAKQERGMTVERVKLKVAVDLDDVCLDFRAGLLECMYREFGVRATREEFTKWDSPLLVDYVHVFKGAGYKSAWDWLKDRDWLWSTFPAVPGAVGGVSALRSKGHYVECLTAKPEWAEFNVWKWLGKWRPAFNRVTIVSNKAHKGEASDADILVDDKVENIQAWVESRPDRVGILFDQPWNQECPKHLRVFRARGWAEVLKLVDVVAQAWDTGEAA